MGGKFKGQSIIKVSTTQTVAISFETDQVPDAIWFAESPEAIAKVNEILGAEADKKLAEQGINVEELDYFNMTGFNVRDYRGIVRAVYSGMRIIKNHDDLLPLRDDDPEGLA